jgi:hypothetical protein
MSRTSSYRRDFPYPLADKNPYPDEIPAANWEVAYMYINNPSRTFKDVGWQFGLSGERIRQMIMRVYYILRRHGDIV